LLFEKEASNFFVSSFDRTKGIFFSFFGRLIFVVMSFFKILVNEYFMAARKRIVEVAGLSESFSAK
jgi:hypothetical protein